MKPYSNLPGDVVHDQQCEKGKQSAKLENRFFVNDIGISLWPKSFTKVHF